MDLDENQQKDNAPELIAGIEQLEVEVQRVETNLLLENLRIMESPEDIHIEPDETVGTTPPRKGSEEKRNHEEPYEPTPPMVMTRRRPASRRLIILHP